MRRLRCIVLLALLLGVALARAGAPEPETLRWVVYELPPYFSYPQGRAPRSVDELGRGELDGFLRLLIAALPGYHHELVEANTARFQALSQAGETLCSVLHARSPERLSWLYFTPLYPYPGTQERLQLYVRRDRLAAVLGSAAPATPVRLAELLKRPELHTSVARGRVFNAQIDALLQAADVPRLPVGGVPNPRILDLLGAGRIDYALELPTSVGEYLQRRGEGPELVGLPLAEALPSELLFAACSRNALGRRHIEAIDDAVRRLARDPQRDTWLRAWRAEPADAPGFKRLTGYLDERGRTGPRIE